MQRNGRIFILCAFFLACLNVAHAGWREPKPVLQLKWSQEIANLGRKRFDPHNFKLEAMDKDGSFIIANRAQFPPSVTILNCRGELIRHIPCPPLFEEKLFHFGWPSDVHVLGDSGRLLANFQAGYPLCVFDYEGRLLNVIYNHAIGCHIYIYPDGRFIMYFNDPSTKKVPYPKWANPYYTYLLHSPDGELLEVMNRPPAIFAWDNTAYEEDGTYWEIQFPDKRYLVPMERELLRKMSSLSNPVRDRSGGFLPQLFDGYSNYMSSAFIRCDYQGRIIGQMDSDWFTKKRLAPDKPGFILNSHGVLDQSFNYYTAGTPDDYPDPAKITSLRDYFIYESEWVDDPVTAPPLRVEILDGWYRRWDSYLKVKAPQYGQTGAGATLEFQFQDQEIPLGDAPHPVYSLWQYQVSLYQEQNPGAILGTYEGQPASLVWSATLDFSQFAQGKISVVSGRRNEMKASSFSIGSCYQQQRNDEWPLYRCSLYDRKTESSLDLYWIGPQITLDPEKPDIIRAQPGRLYHYLFFFETGKDTKIFVSPSFWTGLRLPPQNLDEGKPASILVHSRVWPKKMDTCTLTETAPGSRRFTNSDGSVVYELAFIMDEQKNLVAKPGPETVNYLYFYITDPNLGLDRAPQIVGEQGVDKGEYRAWGEPKWELINQEAEVFGPWTCKPWRQVEREIKEAQFTVKMAGLAAKAGSVLRVTWDEPGKGAAHADVPLTGSEKDGWKTARPLLCFERTGCDIEWYWRDSENLPTPQIPGVITFRDKNVKWEIVGPQPDDGAPGIEAVPQEVESAPPAKM